MEYVMEYVMEYKIEYVMEYVMEYDIWSKKYHHEMEYETVPAPGQVICAPKLLP